MSKIGVFGVFAAIWVGLFLKRRVGKGCLRVRVMPLQSPHHAHWREVCPSDEVTDFSYDVVHWLIAF